MHARQTAGGRGREAEAAAAAEGGAGALHRAGAAGEARAAAGDGAAEPLPAAGSAAAGGGAAEPAEGRRGRGGETWGGAGWKRAFSQTLALSSSGCVTSGELPDLSEFKSLREEGQVIALL